MRSIVNGCLVLLALALPLSLAGCGGSALATVSGKVTYQGAALKGGKVIFVRSDGKPGATAYIGEDGVYTIDKVPAGKVTVCVETASLNPARFSRIPKNMNLPANAPNRPPDTEKMAKRFVPIPAKYADPKTSNLTYNVESGQQKNDIDLK
jgi:hypothetical protein